MNKHEIYLIHIQRHYKKNYNPHQNQKKKNYVYFQYHLYLKYIFIQSKFFLFFHEKLRSEFKTFPTAQSLLFFGISILCAA